MILFIYAVVFIICGTAFLFLRGKQQRSFKAGNVAGKASEKGATQELTAFADFDGPLAVRTDGTRVAFIEVEGKNFDFLTARERDDEAMRLSYAFASLDTPFTIHRAMRPVDASEMVKPLRDEVDRLTEQISRLVAARSRTEDKKMRFKLEKAAASLGAKRELIEEVYIPQAASSDDTYEIQTYVTMSFEDGPNVQDRAMTATRSFCNCMMEAGYATKRMSPSEIVEALINYYGRFPSEAEAASMGLR